MANMTNAASDQQLSRKPVPAVLTLSAVIAVFLIWLIYFKGKITEPEWVRVLPATNALLNSLSAICLTMGFINIKRRNRVTHMCFMISATVFSALFLVSYITYHSFHGDTKFPLGYGWVRPTYLTLLTTHILASIVALPLILLTLFYATRNQFKFHRAVARWTFPIWLYVSVTGVIVYLVLRAYTA